MEQNNQMIFLFVICCICPQISGIQVAELSLDGRHTIDSYLNNTEGIGPNNLTDFSICLRFNFNYLKPISNSILSYSTFYDANALNVEIVKKSGELLLIYICKYIKKNQGCGYYNKKSLKIHQKWHHMCLTLKTDYLNSDEVSITTKMYFDGRLVTGESSKCFEENTDYYGNDIDWVSASNPLNCQLKCQFNEKCKFWTYNTASGGNGLNCWLKSNGDYIVPNFERASGPKYCDKCTTTKYGNGPQKGVECIFPIKFQGKTYNGCVPYLGVASSWCSTKVDNQGNHISGQGFWGYCEAICPKEAEKDSVIMKKEDYQPLHAGGSFLLGQEQDGKAIFHEGGFDPILDKLQGFSGLLTQVELWNTILSESEVKKLAKCEISTLRPQNRVITWGSRTWDAQNASFKDVPLEKMCEQNLVLNQLIWPRPITFHNINSYCSAFNGRMPIVKNNDEWIPKHDEIFTTFKAVNETEPTAFRDIEAKRGQRCFTGRYSDFIDFWMGMQRNHSDETWYSIYEPEDKLSEIDLVVSSEDDNCVYNIDGKPSPHKCTLKFPCGICTVSVDKVLELKGLCENDFEFYDTEYYIYGLKNNRPYFRGFEKSHIFFECNGDFICTSGFWTLQSVVEPKMSLQFEGAFPLGSHDWKLKKDKALCNLLNGKKRELTFTQCYPDKFTCQSGHCIPLEDRCNIDYNCKDRTDEDKCQKTLINENYIKELLPVSETQEPCTVYINMSIKSFPEISTKHVRFSADFYLNFRWYDLRLRFSDLDHNFVKNRMAKKDLDKIWQPALVFTNTIGAENPIGSMIGTLIRENRPLKEDISFSTEAYVYTGEGNSIFTTQRYFQVFVCHFNLAYYPFDNQVCTMEFEIQGVSDNLLILKKEEDGVIYEGSRMLEEYEMLKEDLHTTSFKNVSHAIVKFAFRRRIEYHVTNTFTQTMILVLIGYLSFYFDLENFTDRAMIVLTTMLVIATITSSIQQDLPITSSYKLIDWWFLICFNLMVMTLGFHTYLAYIINNSRNQPIVNGNIKKVQPINDLGSEREFILQQTLKQAAWLNTVAKIAFIVFLIVFNFIFWIIALFEHFKSSDEIMAGHHYLSD